MKKTMILLTLITLLLTACATPTDPSEAYKGESPRLILQDGKKALQGGDYTEAIKHFEALDVQYPFNPETEQAQLFLIYGYYMKEDYLLAEAAADHFIRMHPVNPHVDYAYYMKGIADYYQNLGIFERIFTIDLAKRDLTQIHKSYHDFNLITSNFPSSCYASSAHQYLIYLRNVLANHELQVAQFYYNRRAYLAAANRASNVVAHYQGSPAVIDALLIMINSYHKLKLHQLEQESLIVFEYNYPNIRPIYT